LEMALRVTLPARHGTNRQHMPTLALFEMHGQEDLNFVRARTDRL
jgi:hypothetical protein